MTAIALVFSVAIVALGLLGLAAPARLLSLDRHFQSPAGLYFAAGVRLVMGAAIFFAAPASRAPEVLRALGLIIMLAGVVTSFPGFERFRRLLDWWSAHGRAFIRPWGAIAVALGSS